MARVAGIDVGTQSTKVVVYDTDARRMLASAQAPLELTSRDDGSREQEASWWTEAIESCFSRIDADIRLGIEAIGVSGQQHGFVPVARDGSVLHSVKLWNDVSTAAECSDITRCAGGRDALLGNEGNLMLPGYTASKILWFKNAHPQAYRRMRWIMLPHDYINFWLTGNAVMECGDASGTALLDIRSRAWSSRVLRCIDKDRDLAEQLPPLIPSHASAGRVTSEAANKLGIRAGTIVSSGGGDNMMGAIGTGTVRDGTLTMSLGTSGTLFGASDVPIIDPQGLLAAFCSSSGTWLPLLCTMNCTVASEVTRKLFALEVAEFDAIASEAPIGCEGVVMLPYFNGERTPNYPHGKGCLMGFDLQNMTQANINRAALESAIYGMRLGLDAFKELGYKARQIRLIGGGARSALWRQMVADVCELPVVVPVIAEAAAFGGALQALWCLSHESTSRQTIEEIVNEHVLLDTKVACEPVNANVERYAAAYERYMRYVSAVEPIFG